MKSITINLTEDEHLRLNKLAKYKRASPEDCIRAFIRSCQPGGDGWRPPFEKPSKKSEKARTNTCGY